MAKRTEVSTSETKSKLTVGDIEIFQHNDFNSGQDGWHWRTGLDCPYIGDAWNDEASSVVVFAGTWQLFEGTGYIDKSITLGPGQYPSLEAAGLCNDCLSSFKQIA